MEFLSQTPNVTTKNVYPCLASITIAPASEHGATSARSRRLSASSAEGSAVGEDGDDNLIKRVISGGRRKSSFGTNTNNANANANANNGGGEAEGLAQAMGDRRKSIAPSAFAGVGGVTAGSNATGPEGVERGTWFWRVQAGVHENNLVLLPLTRPANSLLTSPPAPLSAAMPAHHKDNKHNHNSSATSGAHDGDEGLVDKVKNLFRRSSTTHKESASAAPAPVVGEDSARPLDQTAQGDQLPSASANAMGANNMNANAETGWPGVIQGDKLQAVVVPLNQIDKHKVKVSGGKRGEASWVTVPVVSHFAHMIQGHADGALAPKSGVIRLEFDKDWIGSKGEAELLHHHIASAISNRTPQSANIQLGNHNNGTTGHASSTGAGAGTSSALGTGAGAAAGASAGPGLGSGAGISGGTRTSPGQSQHQAFQGDIAPDQTVPFDHATAGSGQLDQNHMTLGQAVGYTPDESVASSRKIAG